MEKYFSSHNSGFSEYMFFHNSIDMLVWLIKLAYSPKENMKLRSYSINELYQYYIKEIVLINNLTSHVVSQKACNKEKFEYFLKQGWYNELAAAYPYSKLQDDIGFDIDMQNNRTVWNTELFPSWSVVKTYYSIYSYYNALVFTNSESCNTYNHRNPTNHINTVLLKKLSNTVLRYPFNIYVDNTEHSIDEFRNFERKEWSYKYASYPRNFYWETVGEVEPIAESASEQEITTYLKAKFERQIKINRPMSIYEVEEFYIANLRKARSQLRCKAPINIIDLLYLFRTWANYTGNDTYIQLKKGGYLRYLQKNLYALNYFVAGIIELVGIHFLGEQEYSRIYLDFYRSFISNRPELLNEWHYIPLITRMRIHQNANLIHSANIEKYMPNIDVLKRVF